MTTSISAISSYTSLESKSPPGSSSQQKTPQADLPVFKTETSEQDSVKLSGVAMARSLRHYGLTVAQIAQRMGENVETVNNYLGITEKSLLLGAPTRVIQA